jgi:peptidoglycan/LPS O-acetylase OafA/YrhL
MLTAGQSPSRIARPSQRLLELDGLRALAILPVILHHRYPDSGWLRPIGEAGWIGVDLFFVLSGFLITGILLRVVKQPHFYETFIARRTVRIFPLYYLCLILFIIATKLSRDPTFWGSLQRWGGAGWFVFYLGNFRVAWMNAMPPIFSFTPLWSLQVEEQFYLLYPLAVLWLSTKNLRRFLIAAVIAAPLLRVFLTLLVPASSEACYVLMPCRMDALAWGGLVAITTHSQTSSPLFPSRIALRLGATVGGVTILGATLLGQIDFHSPFMRSIGYSLIDLGFAALLATIVSSPHGKLAGLLRLRPLVYTGQIAYGLYLLHVPASWAALKIVSRLSSTDVQGRSFLSIPITFAASYVAAVISWHFFERPILSLRERFSFSRQ